MCFDRINHPLFSGKKRIPVGVEIRHIFVDTIVVPDMDTDGDELGVNVKTDSIRFQNLNLDTLIILNDYFGTRIIIGHGKHTAPF
jgi:hypothetical protein